MQYDREWKAYYSVRNSTDPDIVSIPLTMLRRLVVSIIEDFRCRGYFQEYLGIDCVDGFIPGKVGDEVGDYTYLRTRKDYLYPFDQDKSQQWSEDDVFDVIEFLYDHISTPVGEGDFHSYGGCGYHYSVFDQSGQGVNEFRKAINQILPDFGDGYELSEDGEILQSIEEGLAPLVKAAIPSDSDPTVESLIQAATRKFRARHASADDRIDAIRDLAGAFEQIRPNVQRVLTKKDESVLFEIANKFAIRHQNPNQKSDYDRKIWLSWMFYFFLSTLHASLRLIERAKTT